VCSPHPARSPRRRRRKSFATPDDAASALVQAVKARDRNAMLAALGNAGEWLSSGDANADRAAAARFVADYDQKHTIALDGDKATLTIGNEDFPFAFPLVKSGDKWRFDTAAGKEQLLARRIGGNELSVIKVLQAIVDAEQEYASEDRSATASSRTRSGFSVDRASATDCIGPRKPVNRRVPLACSWRRRPTRATSRGRRLPRLTTATTTGC
jgi:hypothetical protein